MQRITIYIAVLFIVLLCSFKYANRGYIQLEEEEVGECPVEFVDELREDLFFSENNLRYYIVDSVSPEVRLMALNSGPWETEGVYEMDSCIVPSQVVHNGRQYKVLTIDYFAFAKCKIKYIEISEGIRYILPRAFEGCWSLSTIIIPKSCWYIGFLAFERCLNLKSVVVPGETSVERTSLESWGYPEYQLSEKAHFVYAPERAKEYNWATPLERYRE